MSTSDASLAYILELAHRAYQHPLFWFIAIFIFRYLRLIVHIISFWLYKPAPVPSIKDATITSRDCSVILPTVDPENAEFKGCIKSCLDNKPSEIFIVTIESKVQLCKDVVETHKITHPDTKISVLVSPIANKRAQVAIAIPQVKSKITVLLDDHVLWPETFLRTAVAPFEDSKVGGVGTSKRVIRTDTGFNIKSFWNMLGAIYLERHNFEIRATNAIDGGVFVISGRTSLHRTEILNDKEFLDGFTHELFFFGLCGPINPDDDNYITRYEVKKGWDIKIQYCPEATIETTLGTYPKFLSQCLRWVRTTWRSNSCSLFTDRTVWYRQPWCVYAVYITSFFNFALFNDAGLMYLLYRSPYGTTGNLYLLAAWIFATKMVKLTPYFLRHPEDLRMLPGYFLFAYYHSFIKLWALLTFWDCQWSGRNLDALNVKTDANGNVRIEVDKNAQQQDAIKWPRHLNPFTDHKSRTFCEHCGGSFTSVWKGLVTEFFELFYSDDGLTWVGWSILSWLAWYTVESVLGELYGDELNTYFPFVIPTLLALPFRGD